MISEFFRVQKLLSQNHQKRLFQRSRSNTQLAGAENLKGFGQLVMENDALEESDP